VLFERRLREGINAGTITMAFRRWRRSQAVAGGRYRTGLDIVEAESVDVVAVEDITTDEVSAAGYESIEKLRADLRGPADVPVYRIRFRRTDAADPRDQLAADGDIGRDQVADLYRRLSHMDKTSPRGAWTIATLTAIADNPGVAASTLAATAGVERATFKRDVRRLKELGLTLSLTTGYRLSPRGESYLRSRRSSTDHTPDDGLGPEPTN
jgi:hypothetical protein